VKTALREAVEDTELKEVISLAIRDALEDPRMREMLRQSLKEALADTELHRATFQGAVQALNPFKNLKMPGEANVTETRETRETRDTREARSAAQSPHPGRPDLRRAASVEAGQRRNANSATHSPTTTSPNDEMRYDRWASRRI